MKGSCWFRLAAGVLASLSVACGQATTLAEHDGRAEHASRVAAELMEGRWAAVSLMLFDPCSLEAKDAHDEARRTAAMLARLFERFGRPDRAVLDPSKLNWYAISVTRGEDECWAGANEELERAIVHLTGSSSQHPVYLIKVDYSRLASGSWVPRSVGAGFPSGYPNARELLAVIGAYVAENPEAVPRVLELPEVAPSVQAL